MYGAIQRRYRGPPAPGAALMDDRPRRMDSPESPLSPDAFPQPIRSQVPPRIWKFWGTTFWGFVVFAAMFVGQLAVVGWFLLRLLP